MENNYKPFLWGCSSAGRAPALQAGGHGFESHHLHQWEKSHDFVHWKPNKKKETKQIVVKSTKVDFEKNLLEKFLKGFSVFVGIQNNFATSDRDIWGGEKNQWIIKPNGLLIYNPNNYLRSSSKRVENFLKDFRKKDKGEQKAVQAKKSVRWMPWHWEPMKDVITCDKSRWGGNNLWPANFRMGQPLWWRTIDP